MTGTSPAPQPTTPTTPADALVAGRLAALVPAVQRSMYTSVLSITVFSALLVRFNPVGLGIWLVLRLAVSAGSVLALRRLGPASSPAAIKVRWLAVLMGVSGAAWGAIPIFVRPEAPEWRAVVILWLFGNQAVVTAVTSPSRPVFLAAIGSVTIVGAIGTAATGGGFGLVLAAILVLGGVYSVAIFASLHRTVETAISSRLEASRLADSLAARQAELESTNDALTELASHDSLTGLLNRRSFTERITGASPTEALTGSGWIGFIDIDRFKEVNDTNGHRAGDEVLITLARRWSALVDAAGGSIARAGGDEFIVALPSTRADEADGLARRLVESLADPIRIDADVITVTCSIGFTHHGDGEPLTTVLARADAALYSVKTGGRNGWTMAPDPAAAPNRSGPEPPAPHPASAPRGQSSMSNP